MGSGHILVYAFDVLMQIYESAGYGQCDAAKSILKNNIYGLDIDDRAFQLAYFAVMMKARQYNRRILSAEYKPNLYSIQESNSINREQLKYFGVGLREEEKEKALDQMTALLDTFIDAKEYGSILTVEQYDWELLDRFVEGSDDAGQIRMDNLGLDETAQELRQMIAQGKVLGEKYWVTVTNPPYMGGSNMNLKLNKFIKKNYTDYKSDFFSTFIVCSSKMTKTNGTCGFFTPYVWMFIQSYEKLRKYLYTESTIETLIQFEYSAFEEATVPVCTFVFHNINVKSKRGNYIRLVDFRGGMEIQRQKTLEAISNHNCGFYYEQTTDNLTKIPSYPVAYWVSENFMKIFDRGTGLGNIADSKQGMATADNNRFLRKWNEIEYKSIYFDAKNIDDARNSGHKWFPYNKGGEFRKWYGNNDYVVNWENDGYEIKHFVDTKGKLRSRPQNLTYMCKNSISWSDITSEINAFRYKREGYFFDITGMSFFSKNDKLYLLALCNTKVVVQILKIIAPTLHCQCGDVANIPVIIDKLQKDYIDEITEYNIKLSCIDWDSFETSWDFITHPLITYRSGMNYADIPIDQWQYRISDAYDTWKSNAEEGFKLLKKNEEELNRIFIDIYGLQDELTPDVADKDITVHRIFDSKEDVPESMKGSAYIRTKKDEIVSLLSYFIGCMFGRYSLDTEGLAYAGGEWNDTKYKRFKPDIDNIIPITDEEYLEDDIISRLCTWLKVVYGEETLEVNLDFIAEALGNKGNTSREVIRNYFLNDFFKDHCQTYSVTGSGKRPIYWLFDSGKQNGFKALIYLHRYNADTIGNLRIDYLHRMQRIYESEINRMQDTINNSTNAREVAAATKRKEKLTKQLKECREYDEKIAHLALSRIELDLDDGVKVNYKKLQTGVDGKFYEVLADSKNIMIKDK